MVPYTKRDDLIYCVGEGKSGCLAQIVASLWRSVGIRAHAVDANDFFHGDKSVTPEAWVFFSESGTSDLLREISLLTPVKKKTLVTFGMNTTVVADKVNVRTWGRGDENAAGITHVPTQWIMNALRWSYSVMEEHCDKTGFNERDFLDGHPGGAIGSRLEP